MLCVVLLQRDMFRGFTLMGDIWDYSKHYCSKAKTALKSPTMNDGDNFESALVFSFKATWKEPTLYGASSYITTDYSTRYNREHFTILRGGLMY